MAKKRKKFLGLFGFGDSESSKFSADARAAIRAARKGKCKLAMKHLYDASPHIQSRPENIEEHREDHRIASIIVTQHCGKDKRKEAYGRGEYKVRKGIKGNKYVSAAFSGANTRKRKPKRRR